MGGSRGCQVTGSATVNGSNPKARRLIETEFRRPPEEWSAMMTPDSVAQRLCIESERPTRAYWGRFATLLLLSVVIAALGLYRNSGALVIAAMLLAPLMTPILGIAAALVKGWTVRLLRLAAFVPVTTVATIAIAFVLVRLRPA
jgi:hypothetical protein